MEDTISIDKAIMRLNEMLAADPIATNALFCAMVPVNEALANHPTIQVGVYNEIHFVRLIGVLNGIFGCDENGCGPIAIFYDNGRIVKFDHFVRQVE